MGLRVLDCLGYRASGVLCPETPDSLESGKVWTLMKRSLDKNDYDDENIDFPLLGWRLECWSRCFGSVFGGSVLAGGASGLHCYPEP